MGVRAGVLPPGTECHHICVDAWEDMEAPLGTVFVSIPTLLDPGLAPPGADIVHIFTPDWIDNWKVGRALRLLSAGSEGREKHACEQVVRECACLGSECHAAARQAAASQVVDERQVISLAAHTLEVRLRNTGMQGLSVAEYERKKEEVADGVVARLERHLPGLKAATLFREVGMNFCISHAGVMSM